MRDLVRWWRERTSQLLVLLSFALLLAWQNVELRRGDGYFRRIIAEIRESVDLQETRRQVQFSRLLEKIECHLSRLEAVVTREHPEPAPSPSASSKPGQS